MEYYRDPKNRIYADIAYRLGSISLCYSELDLPKEEFFPATLNLCILQTVLTNCVELLKSMSRHERPRFLSAPLDSSSYWGLHSRMVRKNTFARRPTVEDVLWRLRHSLSHPNATDPTAKFPCTGYTTIQDGSGNLQTFYFVYSPDAADNDRLIHWPPDLRSNGGDGEAKRLAEKFFTRHGPIPSGVTIENDANGRYSLVQSGAPFARVFAVALSERELSGLVQCLCNHLAQPIQENWDGESIAQLIKPPAR